MGLGGRNRRGLWPATGRYQVEPGTPRLSARLALCAPVAGAEFEIGIDPNEAVNEVNRALQPSVPLEVGGPALTTFKEDWLNAFLDD